MGLREIPKGGERLRVAAAQMRFERTIEGNLDRIEALAGEASGERGCSRL